MEEDYFEFQKLVWRDAKTGCI